jgi:glycosyltransferase involved in cell wall biosynthesis
MSIVTPSYNQGQFLEGAIRSVLQQGYPDLEYVVVDGGSTDRSVEVIRHYADWLSYWVTEPDTGQYDAINKGFARSSGEIMAWINADDMYFPWAFWIVAEIFVTRPEIQWLTSIANPYWDTKGRAVSCAMQEGYSRRPFYRGRNGIMTGIHKGFIMQEATFWRRSLWEAAGGYVDASLELAADFELWARFWEHADLYSTGALLSGFRFHSGQKTAKRLEEYEREARKVLEDRGERLPGRVEAAFLRALRLIPNPKAWLGWKAHFVDYDHASGRWLTRTSRFL